MRVLVTGAAGFIGHHLVEHMLRTTNWDVVGVVSFRHRGCPLRLAHLQAEPRLKLVRAELGAPVSARVAAVIGDVDSVVHLAAESHVDRSIEDPRPFIINNVEVTLSMLEYARQLKLGHFMQFSTDEIYGPAPTGHAHREWDPAIPSNPYAASKAAQEAIAISYWRTYGVPVSITNSMNLIGERQDGEKFVPMLIRNIQAGKTVPIHGRVPADDGVSREFEIGSRMYLHARNLADAICWLLRRPVSRYPESDRPDRWHVVGEREVNNLEMAYLVASILEKPLDYEIIDFHRARPGHDRRYALDASKLAAAGWRQPLNLERSLEQTVRWTASHPEWLVA